MHPYLQDPTSPNFKACIQCQHFEENNHVASGWCLETKDQVNEYYDCNEYKSKQAKQLNLL